MGRTRSQKTLERRESRQGVGVMKMLPRGKENLERLQMGSALALMSKQDILCENQGKVNEAYQKLQDGWLSNGDKVPPAEFAKLASEYSEYLGWFPRGKMAGPFQDVAFSTQIGATSAPFKSTHGYHIILREGRKK